MLFYYWKQYSNKRNGNNWSVAKQHIRPQKRNQQQSAARASNDDRTRQDPSFANTDVSTPGLASESNPIFLFRISKNVDADPTLGLWRFGESVLLRQYLHLIKIRNAGLFPLKPLIPPIEYQYTIHIYFTFSSCHCYPIAAFNSAL